MILYMLPNVVEENSLWKMPFEWSSEVPINCPVFRYIKVNLKAKLASPYFRAYPLWQPPVYVAYAQNNTTCQLMRRCQNHFPKPDNSKLSKSLISRLQTTGGWKHLDTETICPLSTTPWFFEISDVGEKWPSSTTQLQLLAMAEGQGHQFIRWDPTSAKRRAEFFPSFWSISPSVQPSTVGFNPLPDPNHAKQDRNLRVNSSNPRW